MLNKRLLLIIALGYTIVLAILSLLSNDDVPHFGAKNEDKIFHLIAYAILTFLWYKVCATFKFKSAITLAIIGSIAYGIILEVLQGQFTVGRDSSFMDVVANSIGVAIVSLFLTFKKKTIVK